MSADDFRKRVNAFQRTAEQRVRDTIFIAQNEVRRSIVQGSEITGAPGQPVRRGTLRKSWTSRLLGPNVWQVATGIVYARPIEDGANSRGPFTLRSKVGGFHSVKLTRAGWKRIVEHARRRARTGKR